MRAVTEAEDHQNTKGGDEEDTLAEDMENPDASKEIEEVVHS